ncbi:hypothetical protein [Leptolyngbya sp. PCC 6406]|uniref:hypothetical protein n=1 Tax=Leptolyngbya sp. PCC 6406 TaxID=1173264 RepID=UPI0002ABF411|nr:hypothetical protein [Leptolyngbya sp. PCC 6406]
MLRPDLTPPDAPESSRESSANWQPPTDEAVRRLDIQQSLNVLEELILGSPRVPFSRRTLVDEDQLLEQLDRIRLNLPSVFQEAVQIVQQRHTILSEADLYARELRAAADQQAAQRLDDLGIIRQAEAEAQLLRQQAQQDCDAARSQVMAEIEQWQEAARQNWEQMRQQAEANCATLQEEADIYAAQVLHNIEHQLTDMLRVVHNGRQALQTESPGDKQTSGTPPKGLQNGPATSGQNGKDTPRRREEGSKVLPQARPRPRPESRPRRITG